MTDRRTASTITDTELDQLRARLAQAETTARWYAEADSADAAAGSYAHRAEAAEVALARVREIASELFMAGRTQTEREIGRRLNAALDQPAPATATRATHRQEQQ
ncbi:hypothetical protein [Streptomyces bangladeshensis]|uniref:hypothetical protein n=1 Tax=Streptomyces bangladeshensis TaxID=295352 RepID=UPI0031F73063